ncbi:MAG: divergent polysaccharide deacetylase family protein [Pseudorhodoplanes sp.]|jgi:polysaccharide deacetylase 2 family uncharacterized protein YibQ|nr:divergent polysaccharide deacetylase family protein [Pseudorhodoplanes sp.]
MIRDGSKLPEDDLTAPLGMQPKKKKPLAATAMLPQALAGALGLFILVFILWAAIAHDPMGGEPITTMAINLPDGKKAAGQGGEAGQVGPNRYDGPAPGAAADAEPVPPAPAPSASGTRTVTIIDGTSGKRQDVIIPGPADAKRAPVEPKLLETSRHGPIPRVAQDGTRPADSYARPLKTAHGGMPEGPRVVLVIGGLGIGVGNTLDAITKLPAQVTLAFTPYGNDIDKFVARARSDNHEVLLQVPMEPFDYPDNDPGPQTLLSTLAGEQNVDRLHWLFSRFQGYVGVTNYMGARFTASEQAMAPVLREVARRGLIYVDDGSSPRSVANQIAGANNLPFAKADVVIDSVSSPAEIDKALARLEALARDRGIAVGYGSALPVTIERFVAWAKAAQGRGIILAPVSAAAVKTKSST